MATAPAGDTPAHPSADELLRQRDQLHEWLVRLDTSTPDAPAHVVERVRADYRERLERTNESLAEHADALRAELDQAAAELEQAQEHHRALVDEAAELTLRQSVGELDAKVAQERQARLGEEITAVEGTRDRLRADVARLTEVLAGIDGGPSEPVASEPSTPAAPPAEAAADELVVSHDSASWDMTFGDLDVLPGIDSLATGPGAGEEEEGIDVDVSFLEELDRKIADSFVPAGAKSTAETTGPQSSEAEEEVDTTPPPGRRCPECRYTNPVEAKYCEVCDADLL